MDISKDRTSYGDKALRMFSVYFREVSTADELLDHCRLRSQVFAATPLGRVCASPESGVDFDQFDLRARHFILVGRDQHGREEIIGGQRGVYPPGEYSNPLAHQLLADNPHWQIDRDSTWLPYEKYVSESQLPAVRQFLDRYRREGPVAAESSRFHIAPGSATLRLSAFMARAVMAVFMLSMEVSCGITFVQRRHKAFYRHCGFKQISGTVDMDYPAIGLQSTALCITRDRITGRNLEILETYRRQYETSGEVSYIYLDN